MNTQRFAPLDVETADPAVRPLLMASAKNFGFLPSPVAKAARSPALLKHLLAGFNAFDHSSLSPVEREVVAFAVSFEIGCSYCMALHSARSANTAELDPLVDALRAGSALPDPKLEALRQFVRGIVRLHGRVPEAQWQALAQAGYGEQQALDALLGVGVYLMSTLTNIVSGAELDPPFVAFRWQKPSPV
jgi:uncharacterized peroxidase-related enzyme